MNGDSYGSSRDNTRSRDHYSSRHDRDDRRERQGGGDRDHYRDERRDRDRDRNRERRRSRSPPHRSRRDQEDSYSSSRDYRAREREDRYHGRRGEERDWDRDRGPRRRDDRPQRRGGDRDLFDDRRGGRQRDRHDGRQDDRGAREDRDEFAAQARSAVKDDPPPKKREPTPDLTDTIPITERKRRLTQWDIKPPGYETITAEQAKLSGMFPLPGAPRQQMDPSKLQALINQPQNLDKSALKPSTSRQAKRLFLYNVPVSASEQSILNFFNLNLNGLNLVRSTDPCVSVQLARDRTFAMIEFKTAEDATLALALNGEPTEEHMAEANGHAENGVQGFEIKRPKDYIVPSPEADAYSNGPQGYSTSVPDSENKIAITKIPAYLGEDQLSELLAAFGKVKALALTKDKSTDESRGIAFVEYTDASITPIAVEGLNGMELGDSKLKTSLASIGFKQASDMEMGVNAMAMFAGTQVEDLGEGRVLQLLNMVTPEELIDNDEYEEICEDVQEECEKYGKVLELKVPRPAGGSRQSNGVGKIYIKFNDKEGAKKAFQSLAGRKFADRTVVTTYFDEASFDVNAW